MSKHTSPTAGKDTAIAKRSKTAPSKRGAATALAAQDPFTIFTEWTGEADEKAYADL